MISHPKPTAPQFQNITVTMSHLNSLTAITSQLRSITVLRAHYWVNFHRWTRLRAQYWVEFHRWTRLHADKLIPSDTPPAPYRWLTIETECWHYQWHLGSTCLVVRQRRQQPVVLQTKINNMTLNTSSGGSESVLETTWCGVPLMMTSSRLWVMSFSLPSLQFSCPVIARGQGRRIKLWLSGICILVAA